MKTRLPFPRRLRRHFHRLRHSAETRQTAFVWLLASRIHIALPERLLLQVGQRDSWAEIGFRILQREQCFQRRLVAPLPSAFRVDFELGLGTGTMPVYIAIEVLPIEACDGFCAVLQCGRSPYVCDLPRRFWSLPVRCRCCVEDAISFARSATCSIAAPRYG